MPEYICLPRRAGRYAFAIQKALEKGGTIAVISEESRQRILQTAEALKMPKPKVVVVSPQHPRPDPSVSLIIIDYDITKE